MTSSLAAKFKLTVKCGDAQWDDTLTASAMWNLPAQVAAHIEEMMNTMISARQLTVDSKVTVTVERVS